MTTVNASELRNVIGGKTYVCPFCYRKRGSYWRVYAHALKCSYFNSAVFRYGWNSAFWLLKKGLGM